MKKAKEELQAVTFKVPVRLLQRIDELRAELQRQDPKRSVSRSDAMRHVLHESLSADTSIVWPEFKSEDDEKKTGRKAKARR